jgi:hypothetical protein
LIDIEWVIEDLTKSEVQQSRWNVVLLIRKVPLQGFSSVPAESVLAVYCNGEVNGMEGWHLRWIPVGEWKAGADSPEGSPGSLSERLAHVPFVGIYATSGSTQG